MIHLLIIAVILVLELLEYRPAQKIIELIEKTPTNTISYYVLNVISIPIIILVAIGLLKVDE